MRIKGQPSGDEPVWRELQKSFSEVLGTPVRLWFPTEWSSETYRLFQELEQVSFRPSLRYTNAEIEERLRRHDVLLVYVMSDGIMEGVMLCYALRPLAKRVYYFDTLAVRAKGMGLGRLMIGALFEWTRQKGYRTLRLDTEEVNETGHHLALYYTKLGFVKTDEDDSGDITMEKLLR